MFASSFQAISMGFTVEEDLEEVGDCEEHSNRSTCKGLFLNLWVVCRLMEEWIVYVYEYK